MPPSIQNTVGVVLRLLVLLLSALSATSALSAELTETDNQNCRWRIGGWLHSGDAGRIIASLGSTSNMEQGESDGILTFSYFGTRAGIVCLNIPGGSPGEGIALMRFFRDSQWGTFIDRGDVCHAECAIAFMGGTSPFYESETRLLRALHVGGELAFDQRSLLYRDSESTSPSDSARTLAGSIGELMQEIDGEKIPYFRIDLLLALMSLADRESFLIDSVQKAARFNIDLVGLPGTTDAPKDRLIQNICNNLIVRAYGLPNPASGMQNERVNVSGFFEDERPSEAFMSAEDDWLHRKATLVVTYDLDGSTDTCVVGPYYSVFASSRFEVSAYADVTIDEIGSERFFLFEPSTTLSELALSADAAGSPDSVRDNVHEDFKISSFWDHNGSVMALVRGDDAHPSFRAFMYVEPRSSLNDSGVTVGTILFDGTSADGQSYEGTARSYSCGTVPYQVAGIVSADGRSIVLKGKRQRFDQACESTGTEDDALLFSFLGTVDDPEFAENLKQPFGAIMNVRSIQLEMMH